MFEPNHMGIVSMRNEGTFDRGLRGLAGLALLGLALLSGLSLFGGVAAAVGAVLLVTAATGFCPAYRILGLKTRSDR